MAPGDNFYILGYEGTSEMFQDVTERDLIVIFVIKVAYPEDETMTHGSPYKFTMLNNPQIGHLGKTLISPNW